MFKSRLNLLLLIMIAALALFAGIYWGQSFKKQESKPDYAAFKGTLLESPREIAAFSLIGIDKKPFNKQSLQGQWTLMFFGFSNCGWLCPTTLAEVAKMYRDLEAQGIKNLPRVVMVSIDPERDSLSGLKNYVKSFNPNFFAARGEEEALQVLTKQMGIAYGKVAVKNATDDGQYSIDHSGTLILINPQGQLAAFFTMPHHADDLVKDYLLLTA